MALRVEEPPMPTNDSTFDVKTLHEKWEHSNLMSLMFMQSKMVKNIRGFIHNSRKAKEFFTFVEQQFIASNKSLANTLISKLTIMKYNGVSGIKQHIMEMSNIENQLNTLKMSIS